MKKTIITAIALLTCSVLSLFILTSNADNPKITIESELLDFETMRITNEFQNALNVSLEKKYGDDYKEIVALNEAAVKTALSIEKQFTSTRSGEKIYPEYYAGMYINDNQQLVLQIVKDEIPSIGSNKYSTYSSIVNFADNEIVEYVDYSFSELKDVYDTINEYFISDTADYNKLASNSIDIINNRVVIKLTENTLENQKEFKEKVTDSDILIFEQGERKTTMLNPGDAVNDCTLGFRARLNGNNGYVTAGHCVQNNTIKSYAYGTIEKRVLSGNTDAMFVKTSTSISNSVVRWNLYPAITLNGSSFPVVGQMIGKYGNATGATTGKITSVNSSEYIFAPSTDETIVYLTDLFETNVFVQPGDSGGPVFTLTTTNNLMGIVSSGNSDGTSTPINPQMFGIKLSNINSNLGTARY